MKKNERGITLIEVLASIVILSIIGTVIWNVFFEGSNYSKSAVSKNSMLQQANIIMANLTRIHQTAASYTISTNSSTPYCQIKITYYTAGSSTPQEQVFNDNEMCFAVKATTVNLNTGIQSTTDTSTGTPIPMTKSPDAQITLTVSNVENRNNLVQISTTLYRLKGVNN